jgi:DNA modification methylase
MELTKQIWWMYPENIPRDTGHPAPFPEALPNRFINMYSFPRAPGTGFQGDIVLDPFAGWGTTCIAAKRLARRFVGIDLSPSFCNEAARRCESVSVGRVVMPAERVRDARNESLPLFEAPAR